MLQLNKEKLDGSVGVLRKVTNDDFLAVFTDLAKDLKGEQAAGGNAVVDQALENCLAFQNVYNPFVESTKGLLKDITEISQVAEYLEKQANIGSVGSHDASFANQGIQAEDVRI